LGLFITFEGGEGTGKTTHVELLVGRLRAEGHDVVALREPGGTPLGDYLRDWLKATDVRLSPEAELLLFAAARAELVRQVVRPALESGRVVVLDRYADSTVVYQGYGRGLPMRDVRAANRIATGGLVPDLTFLLDGPIETTLRRAKGRPDAGDRRFEAEDASFHRRVQAGFRRLAKGDPERWTVVDTTSPAGVAHEAVWRRVLGALGG